MIGFEAESSPRMSAEEHAPPDFRMSELDTRQGQHWGQHLQGKKLRRAKIKERESENTDLASLRA